MSNKSKNVLMISFSLAIALLLSGCSMVVRTTDKGYKPNANASQAPAATGTSVTPSPSSTSDSDNEVTNAYKEVLQNNSEFYSTDNKKNIKLNDFLTNEELYGAVFKVTHFTVLDMDGDKVPEVVLELSVGDEPQFFEVLHYMDSKVYGYLIVYRGLEALKEDGTFNFSSGAADNGAGKLSFASDSYKTDMLGYSESSQSGDNLTISYFINNETTTKEAFDSFMNEQAAKKDAVWYEFSPENLEAELSSNK